jgi:hypothetical protein
VNEAACGKPSGSLLADFVRALTGGTLRGLDFLAALLADNADEAADCVRLPVREGQDLS